MALERLKRKGCASSRGRAPDPPSPRSMTRMIAKVVAWDETRAGAIAALDRALSRERASPPQRRIFLFGVNYSPVEEFVSGQYDTKFAEALAKRA